MVMVDNPNSEHPERSEANSLGWLRRARTVALVAVVCLPPAINATNIVAWANSPTGLDMTGAWGWIVFGGLDLAAAVCVLETVIQSQQGRKAGAFAAFVWVFALASAYAGYRHGTQDGAGRDVKWFFPLMAMVGPALLHLILKRARLNKQLDEGRRIVHAPAGAFGWSRWVPGVGAFGETYCAWRLARLEGIVLPAVAIARYRALRPYAGRSGLRVLLALRADAARVEANATRRAAPNTGEENTEPAAKPNKPANGKTRTAKSNAAPKPEANGSAAERYAAAVEHFRRQPELPSVRELAVFLGLRSPSAAHPHHKRLVAELAPDDQEREPALVGAR